jgi:hypothetical protein
MVARRIQAFVFATAAALLGTGCGVNCESLCEDRKQCDGEDKSVDCAEYSEKTQALVEDANCEDQYDKLTQCTGNQDDICRPDADACRSESVAYTDCMTKYCSSHPEDCD